MMPTKKQIEAAKAWARAEKTQEQCDTLMALRRPELQTMGSVAVRILLAALEAAEELAKIGCLAVESRRAFYDDAVSGDTHAALEDALRSKTDAYLEIDPNPCGLTLLDCLAKEPKP